MTSSLGRPPRLPRLLHGPEQGATVRLAIVAPGDCGGGGPRRLGSRAAPARGSAVRRGGTRWVLARGVESWLSRTQGPCSEGYTSSLARDSVLHLWQIDCAWGTYWEG